MKKFTFLTIAFMSIVFASCKKDKTVIPTVKVTTIASPVSSNINKMAFLNSVTGFAVCSDGKLLKTTDAGNSWSIVSFTSNYNNSDNLSDIEFPSSTVGYILSKDILGDGHIYKTSDAGNTWALMSIGNMDPDVINFPTSTVGYCITSTYCYKTTNGGQFWSTMNLQGAFSPEVMTFATKDTGYVTDFDQNVFRTFNGGSTWSQVYNGIGNASRIKFQSKDIGYAVLKNGQIMKSTDRGLNWATVFQPGSNNEWALWGIDFSGSTGFAIGDKTVVVSKDGGSTWEWRRADNGLNTPGGVDVYMIDSKSGVACGENGLLYKIELGEQ